jgi:hypothetical protein
MKRTCPFNGAQLERAGRRGGGRHQTLGLKTDGTVVAAGDSYKGVLDVTGWAHIVRGNGRGFSTPSAYAQTAP